MTKFLIGSLISLVGAIAFADTRPFFSSDQVVIVLQGKPDDTDSTNLFNALSAQANDTGSFLEKKVSFSSGDKDQLFAISCKLSKTIANYGSCTLTIFKSKTSVIQPDKKFASLMIDYPDSATAMKEFVLPPPSNSSEKIFLSSDKHVGIYIYHADHIIHLFYN